MAGSVAELSQRVATAAEKVTGLASISRALLEDRSAPESLPKAPVPARAW
jgi:hypothetical protein